MLNKSFSTALCNGAATEKFHPKVPSDAAGMILQSLLSDHLQTELTGI